MKASECENPTGASLPAHMVARFGADWSAWRWAVLRGAGFPADLVLTLAAPEAAASADALICAEDEEHRTQRAVLDARRQALQDPAADRASLNKIKNEILKQRVVNASSIADPSVRSAVDAHNDALVRARTARDAYSRAYAVVDEDLDRAIY